MKKVVTLLGVFLTLFIISCEGPSGPPGPPGLDGLDGLDGSEFEAVAFEIDIDFELDSGLNILAFGPEPYPSGVQLLADDVVLMYRLEEVNNGLDVWRQLPQPFFADQGLLYYNFDFTQNDYSLFIEPDFDATLVPNDLALNQIFRIVIIPANLGASSKMDKKKTFHE